jgi:hypothetical protein
MLGTRAEGNPSGRSREVEGKTRETGGGGKWTVSASDRVAKVARE